MPAPLPPPPDPVDELIHVAAALRDVADALDQALRAGQSALARLIAERDVRMGKLHS